MFARLFGNKSNNNKDTDVAPVEEKQLDPSKGIGKTYSIYLKSQFGKMYCIDGLNNKSTIYDVKSRLEIIAGVAFSKMMLTDDKIAHRLGVPVEEYSFPDEVLLSSLDIKDGQVLMWKKFHETYMKQIPSEKITEHKNKPKWGGFGSNNSGDGLPHWYSELKTKNKTFSITLKTEDEKHKLLVENLTVTSKMSDVMKCIENDSQKHFVSHGLYQGRDQKITYHWQMKPDAEVIWADIYDRYAGAIQREIETEEQSKLYEINYKSFEELIDAKEDSSDHGMQTKVDISKLLEGNTEVLDVFKGCLSKRGWVLVDYPAEIQTVITTVCENVFEKLRQKKTNDKWEGFYQFGFSEFTDYKQVLRVLTGDLLTHFGDKYPKSLRKDIEMISETMDKLTVDIIKATLEVCWGLQSMEEFMNKARVSIVNGWNGNEKLKAGMIDFVQYFNKKESGDKRGRHGMFGRRVNVESHTDPGLFSLSFLSTSDGLQLYDILTKEWVPIPNDCGVLWCGEAAPFLTEGRIKSGIHRVVLSKNGSARCTAWYEASHHNQISRSVINDLSL